MLPRKKPGTGITKNKVANFDVQKAYEQLQQENIKLKLQLLEAKVAKTPVHTNSVGATKDASSTSKITVWEKEGTLVQLLCESIKEGFLWIGEDWTIKQLNEHAERMLAQSRATLMGQEFPGILSGQQEGRFFHECQKAMEDAVSVVFEDFYTPTKAWFEVHVYPLTEGLALIFRDITSRKQQEDALSAINKRHNLVAKATNDSIWDWDFETGMVTRPGNLLETRFGYEALKPEDVDAFWSTHAYAPDWELVNEKRKILLEDPSQNYWEDEYRFLKADGQYGYVSDRAYIIRDPNGKAVRMIGASQDITKEKERINEILRIQQNFESLINATTDPIWSIDATFKIIAANKAYSNFIAGLTGKPVLEGDAVLMQIQSVNGVDDWKPLYERALAGEHFNIAASFSAGPTGTSLHTLVSFLPIHNHQGVVTGVACYQKDVTALKDAGEQLEKLNVSLAARAEDLVTSNNELEKFAYVASHDLQEPLRMVTGFLQLLEKKYKGHIDETATRYIHYAVDGAQRMKQLINDLLWYSRVGTAFLERTPVSMNEVLKDVLLIFQYDLDTAGVQVTSTNLPVIETGRSAMMQLLQNLIGNALKYRAQMSPTISISATGSESAWAFTVADNGIGIDEQFLDKIFLVFQRLHNKDEYSGTGIGLAICKKIVERYNGKIWVESSIGKGSKFIFTIPKKTDTN